MLALQHTSNPIYHPLPPPRSSIISDTIRTMCFALRSSEGHPSQPAPRPKSRKSRYSVLSSGLPSHLRPVSELKPGRLSPAPTTRKRRSLNSLLSSSKPSPPPDFTDFQVRLRCSTCDKANPHKRCHAEERWNLGGWRMAFQYLDSDVDPSCTLSRSDLSGCSFDRKYELKLDLCMSWTRKSHSQLVEVLVRSMGNHFSAEMSGEDLREKCVNLGELKAELERIGVPFECRETWEG